jgi:RNA polymerase sigma factor (sigma-70 family)
MGNKCLTPNKYKQHHFLQQGQKGFVGFQFLRVLINRYVMNDDARLLQAYVGSGSDEAFGELVSRHIDVVYSAALRVGAGDAHLAEDVTQMVFADLARKARRLPPNVVLAGWLYRHSYFTACKSVRAERRRKAREQAALEMNAVQHEPEASWEEIAPLLDDAINELAPADQEAVVLRFFQKRDFRSIAISLGITEDTAQKRVSRALDKLQVILKGRGAVLTTAALGTVIATEATVAAPVGLAISVASASIASIAGGTSFNLSLMNYMAAGKLKTGLIAAALIASVATPLLIQRQALMQSRRENARLQEQASAIETLRMENKRLSGIELRAEELDRLRKEHEELLRLRGQAALAKTLSDELAKLKGPKQAGPPASVVGVGRRVSAADLKDSGLGTPEDAACTLFWAMNTGNTQRCKEVIDVEKFTQALHELQKKLDPDFKPDKEHDDTFSINSFQKTGQLQSVQLLSQRFPNPEEAELEIAATAADGSTETKTFTFRKAGDQWKLDILAMANPDSFNFWKTETQPDGTEITNNFKIAVQDEKVMKLVPVDKQDHQ